MKKEMKAAKKQGFWVLTTLFLAISATAFAQQAEIKSAYKLLNSEQTKKAVETLNKATTTYPEEVRLLYYLGMAQAKTGDTKQAEISFQKITDKDPKNGLGLTGKAYLRMLENKPEEARQLITQALDVSKSKNFEVLRGVGEAYLLNDKFTNDALTHLLKAKSLNDTDPETHILLGEVYLKLRKGGDAVTNFERAAKLDPQNGLGLYRTAMVYFSSKNNAVAEENLIKATTADPAFAPAWKELGELYYLTKQYEKAVNAQEKYLATTESPEKGEFQAAFYYFSAKMYDKANTLFKKLAAKPDVTPMTLKYYAYSLTESKNLEEAKLIFDRYFSVAKEVTPSDYNYYGKLLIDMKLDTLAVDAYAKSYELDTTQINRLEDIAEIWFVNKKNYSKSVPAYKKLIAHRPKDKPGDFYNLGRAQYATKNFEGADTTFRKLIELAPTMTIGYLWAGRTNAALDPDMKKALAKPFFEKLIEMGSTNPEKNKMELVQAYQYLAAYAVQIEDNINKAEEYVNKALALDPTNKDLLDYKKAIKEGREAIRKAQQQQQQQQR